MHRSKAVLIAVLLLGLLAFVVTLINTHRSVSAGKACEKAGGVLMQSRSGTFACVKPLIDLEL